MNPAGGGVAGGSTPGRLERPGRPDRGARRSRFEGSQNLWAPRSSRVLSSAQNAFKEALKGPSR